MKPAITLAGLALLIAGCCFSLLTAQGPPKTVFEGCAMPLEGNHDFLTLCEPHNCALLRGKVNKDWAGHKVKLEGILHPPTSNQPRTIEVRELIEIGGKCDAVCRPAIPGRGIGPSDKPQGEGGTPGAVPQNPPN